MSIIQKAIAFAKEKHKGQLYGNGDYYAAHIIPVLVNAQCMELDKEQQIIALLHDTLEDTDTTFYELEEEFGCRVAQGVLSLTKTKGTNYNDYLQDVMSNEDSRLVKIADSMANLEACVYQQDFKRAQKYLKSLTVLTGE